MTDRISFTIRIPPDLNDWLEQRTGFSRRSKGAEVVFLLEQHRRDLSPQRDGGYPVKETER